MEKNIWGDDVVKMPKNLERTWWEVYQFITCEEKFHLRALIPVIHYNAQINLISKKYQKDPQNQIPEDYVPECPNEQKLEAVVEKDPENIVGQSGLH